MPVFLTDSIFYALVKEPVPISILRYPVGGETAKNEVSLETVIHHNAIRAFLVINFGFTMSPILRHRFVHCVLPPHCV